MKNYLAKFQTAPARKTSEKVLPGELPKLPKPSFGSFGSNPPSTFSLVFSESLPTLPVEKIGEKALSGELPKLPKLGFDGFDGSPDSTYPLVFSESSEDSPVRKTSTKPLPDQPSKPTKPNPTCLADSLECAFQPDDPPPVRARPEPAQAAGLTARSYRTPWNALVADGCPGCGGTLDFQFQARDGQPPLWWCAGCRLWVSEMIQ